MDINSYYLLVTIVLFILIVLYRRVSKHYGYFSDKPIPSLTPIPLFGNMFPLFMKKYTFPEFIQMIYNRFPDAKALGMFDMSTRFVMLRDPELIKKVLVKDFEFFIDRRSLFGDSASESDRAPSHYPERHYPERHYPERHYPERHYPEWVTTPKAITPNGSLPRTPLPRMSHYPE